MYRRYLFVLLGMCGLFIGGGIYAAVSFEPLVGDLTRLGGFAEKDYGWNGEEEQFVPPLAEQASLDGHYPIIVLGDSFSTRTSADRQTPFGSFWTDFLAADSGFRVGVFSIENYSLADILGSHEVQRNPPRLIVLELSERSLKKRLGRGNDCGDEGGWLTASLSPESRPPAPARFRRNTTPPPPEALVDQ